MKNLILALICVSAFSATNAMGDGFAGQAQTQDGSYYMRARYYDPLELARCRFAGQFETVGHDLKRLQRLSRSHPGLVLLLDFELAKPRVKGLAKAKAGELEHCEISY